MKKYKYTICVALFQILFLMFLMLVFPSIRPIGTIKVDGTSMEPTLNDGDIYLFIMYPWYKPKAGDIIIANADGKLLVKRIIYSIMNEYNDLVYVITGDSKTCKYIGVINRAQIVGVVLVKDKYDAK